MASFESLQASDRLRSAAGAGGKASYVTCDGDFCSQSKPGVGYVLLKGYIFFKVGEQGKKGT